MAGILEADTLAKTYGSGASALRILDGISFKVEKGEFVPVRVFNLPF